MVLASRSWGPAEGEPVVCVHGIAQHGGIFAELGDRLAQRGHRVVALDIRGHGDSGREPPWNVDTHVADLFETLDSLGIERPTWVGHSFGGRLAAAAAAGRPRRARRLVLLDPAVEVPAEVAQQSAEVERLDWSFATPEGAVNALLSSGRTVAAPHEVVAAFTREDLRKGPDGRLRFSFSPAAVVVAWSEMALPPPPIAQVPTLVVLPQVPLAHAVAQTQVRRYRESLGDLVAIATVPNGHNVLWEAPAETIRAIEDFLAGAA
ncbi:MAG TPA: alpha/beta hydrolase [Solirubrobacterales bacterium]|nr:alpha/beta hydrolase [Solirubrobacterales bacterium]